MNNSIVLFVTSGIISLCIYCLLLIALVFTLFSAIPTHYSSLKDSMLSLEAISVDAIIDGDNSPAPSDKSSGKNSPLSGSGIKNLFDKVDSKAPSKESPLGDDRELSEQNTKEDSQDAQARTKELRDKLKSLSNLNVSSKSNQSDGEYDEWYAEIESMIHQQWQESIFIEEKVMAIAHIHIKNNGVFSYKIVKYSGNVAFDDSLKSMLEECKQIHFPPHPDGSREIAITFKN